MSPEIRDGLFGLGAAALGAILGGGITWLHHNRTKSRKELTILSSQPSSLIAVDSSISNLVKLTVAGHDVPSVFTADVTIYNSGNQPINDIQIHISADVDGRFIGVDLASTSFALEADAISIRLESEKAVAIDINYLNPADEVVVRALTSDCPRMITPTFRQEGVVERIRTDHHSNVPDILSRSIIERVSRNTLIDLYLKLLSPQYRRWRDKKDER